MTRRAGARREVEEPLELAADRRDVRLERLAVEQVPLGRAARTGRRSSRSRRRRGRPAGRRGAGGGAARRSGRGGRRGATGRTGRSRCSRRSAARSPAAPASPGVVAWSMPAPVELVEEPAQARRRTPVRSRARHRTGARRLDPREAAEPFIHAPYAIVRPQMQTSLARRQRHRRALRRDAPRDGGSTVRRVAIAIPIVLFVDLPRRVGAASVLRRGRRLQLLRARASEDPQGAPDEPRLRPADDRLRPDRQDRARPPRRAQARARRRSTRSPPSCSTRRPRSRTRTSGTTPASTPVGFVSAGARHAQRPAARRLDDHPAARPRAAPAARGVRGLDLRAQDPRDHPVAPPDRGVSRARTASSRSSPPTSTRTSTATRATA